MLPAMVRVPSRRDARRWAIVALGALAGGAAADDGPAPAPARPRPNTDELFGRKPKKRAPGCAEATALPCPRRDDDAPAAVATTLGRAYLQRLPLGDGDLASAAALTLGAGRDEVGVFFAGATGLDTRWTVDGAPIDAAYTGGLALNLPLAFLDRVTIGQAGFGAGSLAGVGGVVDATLVGAATATTGEVTAWLGAGRVAAWLPRGRDQYVPFRARAVGAREATVTGVVRGPIAGGAWYAAGLAPTITDGGVDREAFRRRDADGDGRPDRDAAGRVVHDRVAATPRDALAFEAPWFARLGLDRGAHHLDLTAVGQVARTTRWLAAAEADAAGVDRDVVIASGSATWRGRWGATALRAQAAWFRSDRRESPHTAGGAAAAVGFAYVPAIDEAPLGVGADGDVRAACSDLVDDPAPALTNCPVATGFYWAGGAGVLADLTIDRPSVSAELTRRLGEHRLAVGVAADDVRAVATTRYTGGALRQQLGPGTFLDYRLVELGDGPDLCAGAACRFVDAVAITYRTRAMAVHLTDTWRPAPAIAVEYGVRAQQSQLGTALTVREVLPRIGAGWDFLGAGRSRLFVGWGRYGAALPAGLGERVYAGPAILQAATFGGATDEAIGGSAGLAIAPGTRGTRVDEALAGVEIGQPDVVRLGVLVRDRHLGRALDDEAGALASAGAATGAVATRQYDEVAAWLDGAPTAKLGVRVGYVWSRLVGNWPGPADPVEGITLGTSRLFDDGKDAAYANATGALPNDQPHRFFAELALRGDWRGIALDGSVRATTTSGRARSARLGNDQTFVVPRGALGRLPAVTQANLHLAARRGRWQATLDVLNLFDRRGVLAVSEAFARDATPIAGGDASDLVWLKDDVVEGAPALRVPGFGQPTRVQAPITIVLGVRAEL